MRTIRIWRQLVVAAIATLAFIPVSMTSPARAAGGQIQSCAGLQNAMSKSAHPIGALAQFVDHGCQPPAPPPFNAPSACGNWETPPLPAWCFPPSPPVAVGGANYDSYPIGLGTAQTFTVTNQSTSSFDVMAVVVGGPDASNFALTSDRCTGTNLAGGASCDLTVVFTATAARSFSATLAVSTDAVQGLVYSELSGHGPV